MGDSASFRSPDGPLTGIGVVLLGLLTASVPIWLTEDGFLGARVRRGGGLLKMIEQTIGWPMFSLLMCLFGLWLIAMGAAILWKATDKKPDVTAYPDRIEFHPAVRREATSYDDLRSWSVRNASGHPVVTLRFYDKYWSLKGIFPRTSIVLEGGREDLEDLVNYLDRHPLARDKFMKD